MTFNTQSQNELLISINLVTDLRETQHSHSAPVQKPRTDPDSRWVEPSAWPVGLIARWGDVFIQE